MGPERPLTVVLGPITAGAVLIETARRSRSHAVGSGEERAFRCCNGVSDRLHLPAWVVMQSGSLGAVLVASGALAVRRRPCAAVVAATRAWVRNPHRRVGLFL